MSDAAVTTVVVGVINVVGLVIGFLTMWVKLRYAGNKAEEAAEKAIVVERKLDDNTTTTDAVNAKADTIVHQTNGSMESLRALVLQLAEEAKRMGERVEKLEDHNRTSAHRVIDAVNALHLKVAEIGAQVRVVSGQPASIPILIPSVEVPKPSS